MGDWTDGEIWAPMGSNKDPLEAKKQDELVEEIRLLWCEECAEGRLSWEYGYDEADEPCTSGAEDLCRERARKVIARVVEGPLPREVGRSKGSYLPGIGECETIALRPERAAKEEKK